LAASFQARRTSTVPSSIAAMTWNCAAPLSGRGSGTVDSGLQAAAPQPPIA
jgi:hypothetical protein